MFPFRSRDSNKTADSRKFDRNICKLTESSASHDKVTTGLRNFRYARMANDGKRALPDFDVTPKKRKPEAGLWNRAFEYSLPAHGDRSIERVLHTM